MIYATVQSGNRIKPTPKAVAFCPACKNQVLAKCGSINTWHWAHKAKDCDSWHEPETEWHLKWKSYASPEHCEVVMGPHRADVLGPLGVVVELQNSPISPEVIRDREEFYQKMIWIVNADEFENRLFITELWEDNATVDYYFRWKVPRKSWFHVNKPVFFDIGNHSTLKIHRRKRIVIPPVIENHSVFINRAGISYASNNSTHKIHEIYANEASLYKQTYGYMDIDLVDMNVKEYLLYVKQFNYADREPDNSEEWFPIHRCGFVKKETVINKYFR